MRCEIYSGSGIKWLLFLVVLMGVTVSCRSTIEDTEPEAGENQAAPIYLESVLPPCTPLDGIDLDPCAPDLLDTAGSGHSSSDEELWDPPPTISDVMLGMLGGSRPVLGQITHIVMRGTVRTGTTRCHDYYLKLADYWDEKYKINEGLQYVYCFADIRVNEYLVGEGPPELTISLHREILPGFDKITDGIVVEMERDEVIERYGGENVWLDNLLEWPAAEVAEAYEGKELVLFLRLPYALTLEAFVVDGLFDVWLVQKNDVGDTRAVAGTVDIPLVDLERQIREAAANRTQVTGGRIGLRADLPLLVTDANQLHAHYKAVGAVYDGSEDATTLPPPVPGGNEPVGPPANTGEDPDEDQTPPTPGDDTPRPASTPEDTSTTTTSTTTTSTTTTTTTTTPSG